MTAKSLRTRILELLDRLAEYPISPEIAAIHLDELEPEVQRELDALFANSQLWFRDGLYRLARRRGLCQERG